MNNAWGKRAQAQHNPGTSIAIPHRSLRELRVDSHCISVGDEEVSTSLCWPVTQESGTLNRQIYSLPSNKSESLVWGRL